MIERVFIYLTELSPKLKRGLWRWWYQFMAKSYQKPDVQFMNYGFSDLNSELGSVPLKEKDEPYRYCIQLYHYVATATEVKGKQVLEVGSGRGGGAAYIAGYLEPSTIIGVDFAERNAQLSSQIHQLPNLSFQQGDAEALPFADKTFDLVVNVESSHCYGSMKQFVQEVYRVLKPGGIFSWADLRPIDQVEGLKQAFAESGLKEVKSAEITQNVLEALASLDQPKQNFINDYVPSFLQHSLQEFTAVKDSQIYQGFQTGTIVYLSYVFCKE
ncbi:MAG: methyltransferase domain-containing protein [Symploca sp. SIO1C2]|nr:methyltransferase domain-containing protein [Symploca sp. SIO1C2]